MGAKRCDRLSDIKSMGFAVYLRCPGCDHRGVVEADRVCRLFLRNNWNDALEVAAAIFAARSATGRVSKSRLGRESEHGRRGRTRGARR